MGCGVQILRLNMVYIVRMLSAAIVTSPLRVVTRIFFLSFFVPYKHLLL